MLLIVVRCPECIVVIRRVLADAERGARGQQELRIDENVALGDVTVRIRQEPTYQSAPVDAWVSSAENLVA
jgi:hypothetical protein